MTIAVVERPHAKISPSSFERAERCTHSVRLSAYAPLRLAGPEAQTGTAKHHLLERCLIRGLDTFEIPDETIQVDGHQVEVDEAMLEDIQLALDWVRSNMRPPLLIEKRVSLPFADPYLGSPMFGWIDVATAEGPPWIVADAKFGFNIVEADAVQLGLYLLGLACEKESTLTRNGTAGTTVVIQPNARAEPVRSHDYTFADLRNLRDRVIAALQRIKRQDWSFEAGKWCQYCPAVPICPHLHAIARDPALTAVVPSPEALAKGEFTKETLEDALDKCDILEPFIKRLNTLAEQYLVGGGKLRNRKLVRKRTNRRWIEPDELKVRDALVELGVKDPWVRKIMSPNQAEKALPVGKRSAIKELAEMPPGELTIAHCDDPKPEIEVGATLRRALEASVAAGYLAALPNAESEPNRRTEDAS